MGNLLKKIFLFYLVVVPSLLLGQFSVGLTVGSNTGKFGGIEPPDVSYASRTGINFGAVVVYRINRDFSITLQPTYSQRGSNIEVGEDTFFDSLRVYSMWTDFLTFPIFIRIDSDKKITYFISGLEFGFPIRAGIEHDGKVLNVSNTLKNVDILASIGLGLRFDVGAPDLMIEFRYYQGLVNFNKQDGTDGDQKLFDNFKNSGFQLMAGLEWEIK